MELDKMQLPKVNPKRQQSKKLQNMLHSKILDAIEEIEKASNYEFEAYEVDNVLLDIIKRDHESYINAKFGYEII